MNALVTNLTPATDKQRLGAAVSLDGLRLTYEGGTVAVDDVSLSIAAGEFVSLLGPSGSGKTTTLKMLAGFEHPDMGDIRVADRSMVKVPASKRNIGMVFQNYALFPHMTVFDNVAFPLRMRKRPKAEIKAAVEEVLAMMHLQPMADRYPKQLSGGQQQRVALARAIVFSPPLLLMDEPLGALDRKLRQEVQYELKRIQRKLGLTVVYVTHDQDEALFLSDRIAIMNGGKIAQIGTPPALYQDPDSRFVAEFLGESNFISAELVEIIAGRATVKLPDGAIIHGRPIGVGASAGAAVDVLIRPEKLDVFDTPQTTAAGMNAITGTLEMVNFLGSELEYEIATSGGTLTARSYLRHASVNRPAGSAVHLGFAEGDCMIFARGADR